MRGVPPWFRPSNHCRCRGHGRLGALPNARCGVRVSRRPEPSPEVLQKQIQRGLLVQGDPQGVHGGGQFRVPHRLGRRSD